MHVGQFRVGADLPRRLEPSVPGIRMSISTTSGFSARATATASAPSATSPITVMSSSRSATTGTRPVPTPDRPPAAP
jgi:hypothetical protein